MGNGISEITGMQRTVSGYVDIIQNNRLNEANKEYNQREDAVFEGIRTEQYVRDASGKTEYEKTAEARIKESQEALDRLNKQIEAEQKTNADRDRLARLQQERDEADKALTRQKENYDRYQAQEQAKAYINDADNQRAYQDTLLERQAARQRELELQQKLEEAQVRAYNEQQKNAQNDAQNGYSSAVEMDRAREQAESLERQAREASKQAAEAGGAFEQEMAQQEDIHRAEAEYQRAASAEASAKEAYQQAQANADRANQDYYSTVEAQTRDKLDNDEEYKRMRQELSDLERKTAVSGSGEYQGNIDSLNASLKEAEDAARRAAVASEEAMAAKVAIDSCNELVAQSQKAYYEAKSEMFQSENAYSDRMAEYAQANGHEEYAESLREAKAYNEAAWKAHDEYVQNVQNTAQAVQDASAYKEEMKRAQEIRQTFDSTVEDYEKTVQRAKSAEEYSRFEFSDKKEYEKAVAALEQQGVRVAATTAAMSNDRGDTVYVFEVNRSNSRQAQDIINDYGYEADAHGHYYDDGTYEAKRSDDNHGMGREAKDVERTKRQYESALSGYGNLIFRETGELYHMYLMASDINDFVNGAARSVAMESALINNNGEMVFQNKEQKGADGDSGIKNMDAEGQHRYRMDVWKNPYEAIGLNTGAYDETVMRIRGSSDEFVKKLSKETGRHLYSDKELREISAASLTRADVEKLTKSSLDKLHSAGLIKVLDNGNIDMAALSKLSPDVLKKAGIDPEMFKKVVMRDLRGVEQWGAFAGVKAAGASVGKGLLRFVQKADDNEGNMTQTVNEVRQGVDYFKRPVNEIEKAVKKARQIRQSKKRIKDPNNAAGKKVDTSKVRLEKTDSAKVRKNRQSKIKASEKSVAKAKGNLERRNKLLEKWDKSIFRRGQKKLAKVSEWFFSKTVIGKAVAAVSSTVSTIVSTILLPAIGIGVGAIFMLAYQLTAIIVIVCLVNSLFDFEISPDEGVTYTIYHDILKGYEDDWLTDISSIDNIWAQISSGKDIRFGSDYKPWTEYAKTKQHLVVQDDGWDTGLFQYKNLKVYLNPFDFEPMYPGDGYYVEISKNGTIDPNTHQTVGKFGDAGNMLTFYPNMTSAAKKGAGGHTSNIKDIICMMDVMFNFQKTLDEEANNVVGMDPVSLVEDWIKDRLKYGLRLIMDIFTPTPHDPSIPLDLWSHMRAYCENLFVATHQEMLDIDVIIFDCTSTEVSYIPIDSSTDLDMTDANYRDDILGGYLTSGCPGNQSPSDKGGCKQSKFYACVGGSTGGYSGNLGIVAAAGDGITTFTTAGQFGKVGTLTGSGAGGSSRLTVNNTTSFCISQGVINELNNPGDQSRKNGITGRLGNFLESNGCWRKSTVAPSNPETKYLSTPPAGDGWSPKNDTTTITNDTDKNNLTSRTNNVHIVSKVGDDKTYDQYILIAVEKWKITSHADQMEWTRTVDKTEDCDCDLEEGETCSADHTKKVTETTKTWRDKYERVCDVYYWSVAAESNGKIKTTLPTISVDSSLNPTVSQTGTTCQGHNARYCGGHTFVDMKGIIFSFTDAEIAAANGKTYESPTGGKSVILPVIDEEKLNDVIQTNGTNVAMLKGWSGNSIIHDARKPTYEAAGVYGLNIITSVYDKDGSHQMKTWAKGYDSDGNGIKGHEIGTPVVNPNVYWERGAAGESSDLTIGGVSVRTFFSSYDYEVNKMLYVGSDIFDIDASIDYPVGFFPQTEETYTGWTETNMYLALQRYNMSWEDIYSFDIPVNFNCPQLSETQIAQIVEGVKKHYGSLKTGEENAIMAALQAVGNGQYSQMHHGHGYLLKPDIQSNVNMEEYAYNHGLTEQDGHPCTATDCSGFASYVVTMGGDSGILSEGTDTAYKVWTTNNFYSKGAYSKLWDGTCEHLRPGDVFIHTGGAWHALIYIGCLDEDLTISWVTNDGGYTFLKDNDTGDYEITSQITIKAGMPITVDCTRLDSKGNIYLRNGGIVHNWLPASPYITNNDGHVYVYRPNYPN